MPCFQVDNSVEDVEEFEGSVTKEETVEDETDTISLAATESLSRCSSFRTNSSAAAPMQLKKSVSFFEYAEMVTVESLKEYDPEIIQRLWHKADDLQSYRREAIAEVRSFMRKHSVEDVFMARRLLYNGSGVPREVRNKFRKQADCDATDL